MSPKNTPSSAPIDHMSQVSSGWDKDNARNYLRGRLSITQSKDSVVVSINGSELQLGKVDKKHLPYLEKLVETLVVEKSVCEARAYLAAQCRAEVAKKGVIPTYSGPDIEFNPSFWRGNTGIMRYEVLQQIFDTNAVRPIASSIVDFVNALPTNYIPLNIIEKAPPQESKK